MHWISTSFPSKRNSFWPTFSQFFTSLFDAFSIHRPSIAPALDSQLKSIYQLLIAAALLIKTQRFSSILQQFRSSFTPWPFWIFTGDRRFNGDAGEEAVEAAEEAAEEVATVALTSAAGHWKTTVVSQHRCRRQRRHQRRCHLQVSSVRFGSACGSACHHESMNR